MSTQSQDMATVATIDGWLSRNEAACLHKLASEATGPIVEIGSWKGRSTAALALGSLSGGKHQVFAIDSFVGVPPIDRPTCEGHRPGWNSSSPEMLRANLDSVGINGTVRIIAKKSVEALPDVPDCDLLFVDGAHDYGSVKCDLLLYMPKVRIGGRIVVHDVCEADPGVSRAVDELLTSQPDKWRLRWRVDSAVVFERRDSVRHQVLLGFPGHTLCYGAAKGLMQATIGCHDVELTQSGIGWDDMNRLWVEALNRSASGEFTHFAMLHSDIMPAPGWVDLLLDELDDRKADFISAVAALKDENGLTSCGIGDATDPWTPFRRFTMRELIGMPETFDIAATDHPDKYLLHNSGCWIADMRNPLWRSVDENSCLRASFAFPIRARLLPDGKFVHERESEDWHFSRMIAGLGVKTLATRRVSTVHYGQKGFRNDHAWGKLEHDEPTRPKWGPQ